MSVRDASPGRRSVEICHSKSVLSGGDGVYGGFGVGGVGVGVGGKGVGVGATGGGGGLEGIIGGVGGGEGAVTFSNFPAPSIVYSPEVDIYEASFWVTFERIFH